MFDVELNFKDCTRGHLEGALRALDEAHWYGIQWECDALETPDEEHVDAVVDRIVDLMAEVRELVETL